MIPAELTPTALRMLRVMLEECNLTRAAERLRVTPSAVSRTLARLRVAFDDPLLVRTSSGLVLTEGARTIQPHLAAVLDGFERLLQPAATDPAKFRGTVKAGISQYAADLEIERILPALMREAPGVSFQLRHLSPTSLEELETGGLDLAVSLATSESATLYRASLHSGDWVGVVRSGHPLAAAATLETYFAARHLAMTPSEKGRDPVDQALSGLGSARRDVALSALGPLSAAVVLAASDLVLTVPRWVGEPLCERTALIIVELPGMLPPAESSLYWHARAHRAPLFMWFRRWLLEALRNEGSRG